MAAVERIFVDTSVLAHAHDLDSGLKRAIAEQVLKQLWQDETGVLSTQVLQEFYAALTAGIASPVPRRAARDLIHAYSVWPVTRSTPPTSWRRPDSKSATASASATR